MTAHYLIESSVTGRKVKVSYRKGVFFRMEVLAKPAKDYMQLVQIAKVTPPLENLFDEYRERWKTLTYTKIEKKQSYHQQYVSTWFAFYQKTMNMPPRFNAGDGRHITQIKNHLTRISDQDQEGLELFKLILDNWHKLDDFHKDNTDLKYINSRLNVILNATRKAGQAGTGGADNSVRL